MDLVFDLDKKNMDMMDKVIVAGLVCATLCACGEQTDDNKRLTDDSPVTQMPAPAQTAKHQDDLESVALIKQRLPLTMDVAGNVMTDIKTQSKQIILTYQGKSKFNAGLKDKFMRTHALCGTFDDGIKKSFDIVIEHWHKDNINPIVITWHDCTALSAEAHKKSPTNGYDPKAEAIRQDMIRQQTLARANMRAMAEDSKHQLQQQQRHYQQQLDEYNETVQQMQQQAQSTARTPAMEDYCSKPVAGARGMTAKQMQTCFGVGGGSSDGGYSAPASNSVSSVTNCDGAGCWGTDGTRYNGTGNGQNFYDSQGRFCQNIGGQMQCH